jgi:hypothetical protein
VSGTFSDTNGALGFDLRAAGSGTSPLFTLSVKGVTLTVASVELGNAAPPTGCSLGAAGDLWLDVNGSLSLTLASSGSVSATGCFDLTDRSFALSASISSLGFSVLGGNVSVSAPTVTIGDGSGGLSASIQATLTVQMPSGGTFAQTATLEIENNGFVVGAESNLSAWLGSTGDTAYLYYASAPQTNFDTGDPTIGTNGDIDLAQGFSFALSLTLPASAQAALATVHLSVPTGSSLTAIGTANFAQDLYSFKVSFNLGSGASLFSTGGTSLVLDTGFLEVTLSPAAVSFSVGLTATLNLPAAMSGDPASSVPLTGLVTAGENDGTPSATLALSVGDCDNGGPGWTNGFGIPGLTVQCAALQVGVTDVFPYVTGGLTGTITGLPPIIASTTGYQEGAPITFAFNLDPFLLDLSIGTKDSGTPALEPLEAFGQGSLIQVDYASLYISPQGATLAGVTYPAGIGLGFQAVVAGANINVLAQIGLSPPSINFTGSLSQISFGPLSVGPVSITLAASTSPPNFEFQFSGAATLGPGSANVGPDLKVGGELSASVEVDISTSGISAYIWGNLALQIAVYVPTSVCYQYGFSPYACDYEWESTGFSATLGKTGFALTSSGLTLAADGYAVTFNFSGSVSVSTLDAAVVNPDKSGRVAPSGAPSAVLTAAHRTGGPEATLTSKVTKPTRPIATGRATLLPGPPPSSTPAGGSTGPSSGGSASPGSSGGVAVAPIGESSTLGRWSAATPMSTPRVFPVSVTLDNGDVLVAGGADGSDVLSSAELFNPTTGRWSATGSMSIGRVGASALLLSDGEVLVAGGSNGHQVLDSAELYNPASGQWSPTGRLAAGRAFAGMAPAPGGAIIVGGSGDGHVPLASTERYNLALGTWTSVGSLSTPRVFASVSQAGSGVLVAGGTGPQGTALASAELFNPSTGRWSSVAAMPTARAMASGSALSTGSVLVVGSAYNGDIYHVATHSWTETEGMAAPVEMPAIVTLPGGRALVAGGSSGGSSVGTTEMLNLSTDEWLDSGTLPAGTVAPAVVVLLDGRAFVVGGERAQSSSSGSEALSALDTAEIFSPKFHHGVTRAAPTALPTTPPRPGPAPFPKRVALPPIAPKSSGTGLLPYFTGIGAAVLAVLGVLVWARRRRLIG